MNSNTGAMALWWCGQLGANAVEVLAVELPVEGASSCGGPPALSTGQQRHFGGSGMEAVAGSGRSLNAVRLSCLLIPFKNAAPAGRQHLPQLHAASAAAAPSHLPGRARLFDAARAPGGLA